ncbi:MAG: AAA family ATPase, partial [Rhodothermales bacterium]
MAEETDATTVRLQVAGANERDVGKGTARISKRTIQQLRLNPGDPIEIIGHRSTAAMALPPYPEDEGLEIIRLDGLIRANAHVGMGDQVEVRRADITPARKIILAPAQQNIRLMGSGEALKRTLLQRPLVAGDVVSTSVYRQTPDMNKDQFPEEIFRRFFEQRAFGLQEIRLMVTATSPRGIVQVTAETEIELRPQYEEPEDARATGVTYDDIGGIGDTIDQVREMIELPLKHPELFQRLGIDPPKGVLLHGPPGTGKTLLARAVANESEASFYDIAGPEIMGRYFGESEERLREVFSNARENAPAIIFIDEIDSIAPKRSEAGGETERRIVAQLLTLLDGIEPRQNVVVIGATNRVDALDEALRRPGRFDREIIVGVPDTDGRRQILGIHTRGMPVEMDVDLEAMARTTYGFVGADLAALAREAAIEALRRNLPEIDLEAPEIPSEMLDKLVVNRIDFDNAMRRIQPSALREIMIQV